MILAKDLKEALAHIPDYVEVRLHIELEDEEGAYADDRSLLDIQRYDGGSRLILEA